jgi:hypothetical protein
MAAGLGLLLIAAWGQQAGPGGAAAQRRYLPNMAEEDWGFLKDRSLWSDGFDPVKYIALPKEGWFVTLGGEARLSPQGFRVRGDSETPATIDNYFLQRYLFGADVRMGPRFRFYGELQSGIITGRIGSPRPTDKDLLELHQGFFEFRSRRESARRYGIRIGRQELNIGSGRLIAPSQGLNVKRSFDGISANLSVGLWTVEGGAAQLVRIRPGAFDDSPSSEQGFWGGNVTRNQAPWKGSQVSFYYLGVDRKVSVYAQGIGPELRHTIGGRLTGKRPRIDYNYDLIYQWGEFRGLPARGWAVSTDTGTPVRLGKIPGRLGVTLNSSSGDADPKDGRLGSFNPLFPGNAYSGLVGLLGPTNLTDVTPSLKMQVRKNLLIAVEVPSYFRVSTRDGLYGTDMRLILAGQRNLERYVGTNPGVVVAWQTTRHINVTGAITRFQSGPFLSDTFARNGFGFYSIAGTYRF